MDSLPQTNISPVAPEKDKSPGIVSGVVIGIVQLIVMSFVISYGFFGSSSFVNLLGLGGVFNVFGAGGSILYIYILLLFLPLIIESIFLRKTHKRFIKGVLIGTILVPLIGFGLCFVLLANFRG